MLPEELLRKYDMKSLDEYKIDFGDSKETEINFYKTFLLQTDYIDNKIIEAKLLGATDSELIEKYSDILLARNHCREQINRLEA